MIARVTDNALWAEVRKAAGDLGWHDREALIGAVHRNLCHRLKLTTDEDRDTLRGRLDRLWIQHMTDWGMA